MSDAQSKYLLFDPKPWTKATVKQWSITEDELAERQKLEDALVEKQAVWRRTALENLQADRVLYQKLLTDGEIENYLRNAVKEATLEALSGILHRYTPEEVEDGINRLLLTPHDERSAVYARMEEVTESIYSFINLMRGRELPDGIYIGKITEVTPQIIEDESDRNYGKQIFIFEIEIAEGFFTGKIVKVPLILKPYLLDFKVFGEIESERQQRIAEHHRGLLSFFRNIGVVITDSPQALTAQIAHVVGNTIAFNIERDGTKVTIDKVIERTKTVDEMLSYDSLPDGDDSPI